MRLTAWINQIILLLLLNISIVHAQEASADIPAQQPAQMGSRGCSSTVACLNSIVTNTYFALQKLNRAPVVLRNLGLMALNWNKPDDSESTSTFQNYFAKYGNSILTTEKSQVELQQRMKVDLFANGDPAAFMPTNKPKILETIPYINDLSYSTLLGIPPVQQNANLEKSSYNYMLYASGGKINPVVPGSNWRGTQPNIERYNNYYATSLAVKSFNSYLLSRLYIESQKQNLSDIMQKKLINQATTSTWFSEIASEELGKVLRQILAFQSQSFVLLTQLVQLQKDLLSAQVMTNSLLLINNQNNEPLLVLKAQGSAPG